MVNKMAKVIKFSKNSTDIRIVYKDRRAIATIERTDKGKYRVIRLYNQLVWDCDSYTQAREMALDAANTLEVAATQPGVGKDEHRAPA